MNLSSALNGNRIWRKAWVPVFFCMVGMPAVLDAAVSYTYDAHHRLIEVAYDNGATIGYSYDGVGNRLSVASTLATLQVYEDGEDGTTLGWDIYDADPSGASIANVYDSDRAGQVIELTGTGTANAYRLRSPDSSYWNDTNFSVLQWSMKYNESFTVYVAVQTEDGFRYLYYTPATTDNLGDGTYIHHGLGTTITDGSWHTLVRDLAFDLKEAQPDNELTAVLGFLIRGSGRVDDIKTLNAVPADLDSDGDGLTDVAEIATYGTNPYHGDSDNDGLLDNAELAHWGADWNTDLDGDGLINLLDPDSDNDGFDDGIEVAQGTDPANVASAPTAIHYEDGEDGTTLGWDIYDADPSGASIANVYDSDRASWVIELTGTGTANGYRLRSPDSSDWNDTNFSVLQWSIKYNESFTVYVAVKTKEGFRYLYYTPAATNNLGDGTYIHHGLDTAIMDGSWHTLVRDLAFDLKEAQPDNELTAVLGFLIRGSGRVDDIKTLSTLPADLDSDGDGLTDVAEIATYNTNPYHGDSDKDGLLDNAELALWGTDWNTDLDGDGLINLLDPDSDNDGFDDGIEVAQGTDPANVASVPTAILYEDGEDGTILGWDIYDADPSGASIANVYDSDRAGQVIELTGTGTANGYRLRSPDLNYWDETNFSVLQWSMKYNESFTVYVAVQTKDGFRYLYYTPAATNNLGDGTYIHHGLGTAITDGSWHTLVRDLAFDLKEAQPDNELTAVLGFLIRGSGRVDDVLVK